MGTSERGKSSPDNADKHHCVYLVYYFRSTGMGFTGGFGRCNPRLVIPFVLAILKGRFCHRKRAFKAQKGVD